MYLIFQTKSRGMAYYVYSQIRAPFMVKLILLLGAPQIHSLFLDILAERKRKTIKKNSHNINKYYTFYIYLSIPTIINKKMF